MKSSYEIWWSKRDRSTSCLNNYKLRTNSETSVPEVLASGDKGKANDLQGSEEKTKQNKESPSVVQHTAWLLSW
jgi:hypothetical protein